MCGTFLIVTMIWGVDAQLSFRGRGHDMNALHCSGQSCMGNNSPRKMPIMPTLETERVMGSHWRSHWGNRGLLGFCEKRVHKIQSHVQEQTGCWLSSTSSRSPCCSWTRHLSAESLTASLAFLSASAEECWVQLSAPPRPVKSESGLLRLLQNTGPDRARAGQKGSLADSSASLYLWQAQLLLPAFLSGWGQDARS